MIGELRHKITLLTSERISDGGGGADFTWSPAASLWARVVKLSSTQDFIGDSQRRLKRLAATIRKRDDIDTGMRVFFEGNFFEITSIETDDERERRVTLICEEVTL